MARRNLQQPAASPPTAGVITAAEAEQIVPVLRALADPVRLGLVSLTAAQGTDGVCVCDLNDAFDLSQPTISHHLGVLHQAGLLSRDKRGVWVYYSLRREALAGITAVLEPNS